MKIHFSSSLFFGVLLLSQFACSSKAYDDADHKGVQNLSDKTANIFEYDATQGVTTDPGKYVYLHDGISADVSQIVKAVRGVVTGGDHARALCLNLPREQWQREENLRRVDAEMDSVPRQ